MRSKEAQEQAILIQWCKLNENRVEALKYIFHVPNGGYRNKIEAANLKRQGVKSGVPDLLLLVPNDKYIGLAIEMKVGKNKATENQLRWLKFLKKQGYKTCICYGAEEGIKVIKEYLKI